MHFREATKVKVVLPHWFDDCFKLLARVPEDSYEWPDPPMLRLDQKFKKQRLPEATKSFVKTDLLADKPEKDQIQALTAVQTDIWRGKKVLLSSSLGLDEGRRSAVEVSIKRAGGVPVELLDENTDIDDADVFITQHREGNTFVKVNFLWLSYHCAIDSLLSGNPSEQNHRYSAVAFPCPQHAQI